MGNLEVSTQPEQAHDEHQPMVRKRPWSVTLLVLIVLTITIINFLRLVLSLWSWSFITSRSTISPAYLALTGLIWSVAGGVLIWSLWTARPWSPKLMQAVGLTYALYYWLDQIFLKDHPIGGASGTLQIILPTNWPFAVGTTVVLLLFMEWTLSRAKVKAYFAPVTVLDDRNAETNA